jgi:flagellar protein FlbD
MIEVTRLDDSKVMINADLIQSLQATPDTIITFTSQQKMMVKEPVEEVSKRIRAYQQSLRRTIAYVDGEDIALDELEKCSGM